MTRLSQSLENELQRLAGTGSSAVVSVNGDGQTVLAVEFQSVETVSSLLLSLTLDAPALQNAIGDQLQKAAEDLCVKVTYLLENIGLLEIDPLVGQVLVRSTTPTTKNGTTEYYEVLLRTETGRISLERWSWSAAQPTRQRIPLQLTHEVLLRFVDDLEDTVV